MNYTKTSILFAATFSLLIAPAIIEDVFAAERIPGFMKTNIEWYAAGQISEDEFINALTYLMNKDIIVLDQTRADAIKELRDENAQLRKQMVQYRESDYDFAQRMQEEQAMHQTAPDSWDGSDDPTRFDQAQNLGPEVIQKKHIANVAAVPMVDENGMETSVLVSIPDGVDPNAFVQMVLRESYMETNKDLQFYAEKVRHYNDMKEAIRDHMSTMRSMHTGMMTTGEEMHTDEYGRVKVQFPWMSSDESIKQHIAEMKKSIDSLPPDRQKAAISSLRTIVTTEAMSGTSGAGGDITIQGGSGSGTGDAADYDRLTMKADLDEHEGTISEFLVLQKELETIETDIDDLTKRIDSAMVQQKTLRNDITLLKDATSKGVFPTKVVLSDGVIVLESARDADALVKKWEEQLSSIGDDAQLANIDLQNALQKQQQTLQTMSNVSKMLHDTAMAIIRKIG